MKKKKLLSKWLESFLLLTCILTSAYAQLKNVALNKPTVQGPYDRTEDGGGGSQLAVNDNTRQDGGFAHSVDNSNRGPPWLTYWQVDLQQRYNISSISIWFALLSNEDMTMKRQRGYSLEVSDTPFSLSEGPRGQLCYHDNGEQTEPLPTATFDNCSFTGRYVILYNQRPLKDDPRYSLHPTLQLTEVMVLALSSRSFTVSVPGREGNGADESRRVTEAHYTGWPAFYHGCQYVPSWSITF